MDLTKLLPDTRNDEGTENVSVCDVIKQIDSFCFRYWLTIQREMIKFLVVYIF